MADEQPTNPRIEELRSRLDADPKSRLFYPLAEELRKLSRFEEAEEILREGLEVHASYLSAWISLGRVLKDLDRHGEAVQVLEKALTLDQGNVVAAKLLAESYLELDEKVEAIKKYKLVNALMPADEEVVEKIAELEGALSEAPTERFLAATPDQIATMQAIQDEPEAHEEVDPPPGDPVADEAQSGTLEPSPSSREEQERADAEPPDAPPSPPVAPDDDSFELASEAGPEHRAESDPFDLVGESAMTDPAASEAGEDESPSAEDAEAAPVAPDLAIPFAEHQVPDTVEPPELEPRTEEESTEPPRFEADEEAAAAAPIDRDRDPRIIRLERWLERVNRARQRNV